ncbi:MAG: response regulator transcription factor [Chloroflexota bacterium]
MIKILICDDQQIVREGLEKILSTDPELKVVGLASDGLKALALIPDVGPDLVLMDLKMPKMNGTIATRKIKEKYPEIEVLILSTYDDDEWVFDAVRSGAAGYLLKDLSPDKLIESIKGTIRGEGFVDPKITKKLLADIASRKAKPKDQIQSQLSEREHDILELLTKGLSNADIAENLILTEGTVRNYTSEIFKKLSVTDRTQAVVAAIKHGLVELD